MRRAIDHYFELALYLLVLTGFATLAETGGLDLPSIVIVGGALAIRGYLLAKRRKVMISDRWTTPLSLAYIVFFAIDYFIFSHSFLPATLHLALFGVVIRLFSLRRERDYITLAILAFLMVLASAVLTVDSVFLLCFSAFMLMAVATFVLMEMRRTGSGATIHARHTSDPQEHRHLAFALARFAPVLVGLILVCATGLFFIMPRMSAGYLGGYSFGTDFSAGFSDHVQLGQIGQIQQSNAVVMHIKIDGDTIGSHDLHWRGVALADFDGKAWSKPKSAFILQKQFDSTFVLPPMNASSAIVPTSAMAHSAGHNLIHYHVLMEPIGTNVFFLAPWAHSVKGTYRMLAGDSGGAVYDFDSQHAISSYEGTSDIATPKAADLRHAGHESPEDVTSTYLRLPAVDPRVVALAAQITASATNDYDRAAAIEQHLRTRYGYTLQLPAAAPKDPIANFLFERKQGHCEYFASSMAVMLRTLGIPARVVNGFRSDEFNDLTGSYLVRAKDAHAWVEAYFPGYGWQTFDPTPSGTTSTPQGWARLALYVDAMASFWREWIVTYDTSHQFELGKSAITGTRGLWESARQWAHMKYAAMLKWAKQSQQNVEVAPGRWTLLGTGIVVALLLLANLARIARALHEKWLGAHPERSPEQAAAMWYGKMARVLARRGFERPAAQTVQEFANSIRDEKLRGPVAQFTDVYESARFGNSVEDAQKLPELLEAVEMATQRKS